jgi:dihydroorotate dehydrogenase electron transfer subunit
VIRQETVVIRTQRRVAAGVRRLSFHSPRIARAGRPGTFVHVRIDGRNDPLLRRPFSINDVRGDEVFILYRAVGAGTGLLSRMKAGDALDIVGPLGHGFNVAGVKAPVIIAGGMGLAPMPFLVRNLRLKGLRPRLYFGCRSRRDLLPVPCGPGTIASDDGTCGFRGPVTAAWERDIHQAPGCAIFACGPWPMLRQVASLCLRYRLPCQVSLEAQMACGVGACQGCVVKGRDGYRTVCQDGPVFGAAEIDWDQQAAT